MDRLLGTQQSEQAQMMGCRVNSNSVPGYTYLLFHTLEATSIEKSLKISASGRNFLDPSPLFEKGPYR